MGKGRDSITILSLRKKLLMTASIVKGITFAVVNRSVHANATISMVVDERSLGLPSGMKHRIALPTKATILKIIKTVDSTTTVVLFLDSSCSCKMANTSPLVSPGSTLFMAQTQEAKNLSLCRQPTAYFLQEKKNWETYALDSPLTQTLWYFSIILLERD